MSENTDFDDGDFSPQKRAEIRQFLYEFNQLELEKLLHLQRDIDVAELKKHLDKHKESHPVTKRQALLLNWASSVVYVVMGISAGAALFNPVLNVLGKLGGS